jgi:hypothetical protein
MRRALVGLMGIAACADPPPPPPEPLPVMAEVIEAAAPDLVVRWDQLIVFRWPATIERASGIDVEAPCFIEALGDGPRFRRVVAICGARTLYDTDDTRYGGPVEGATLRERIHGDALVHALAADLTTGDVRLNVATREETATIEHGSWLGWSVTLKPVAWTEPRVLAPLLLPGGLQVHTTKLYLTVHDSKKTCNVDVRLSEAFGATLQCEMDLECDGARLFGGAMSGACTFESSAITSIEVRDDRGRPTFTWTEAGGGKATLDDGGRLVHMEGTSGMIGVPECDEYVATSRRCLPYLPEPTREAFQDAINKTIEAWQEVAKGPSGGYLATACEAARDAMASTFRSYGCTG